MWHAHCIDEIRMLLAHRDLCLESPLYRHPDDRGWNQSGVIQSQSRREKASKLAAT